MNFFNHHYFTSLCVKFREYTNPYLGWYRRRKLKNKNVTIISNNCWGGHVYRYYNLPYDSPTIGLYLYSDDYVKFCCDLRYYISLELDFVEFNKSKHYEELRRDVDIEPPIGVLDDIEIIFLHYKTEDEAYRKWNRRKNRIHWDNLVFKMSEQNSCSLQLMQQFDNLPYDRKFIFVSNDYHLNSQIIFWEYYKKGMIPNDTTKFHKYVNLTQWLNGEK